MRVGDMMRPEGRVFLKSEWGPISDYWPCVSFTKRSVGDRLRRDFSPGRDALVYVGTTNPDFTEDADHRSRLISAVVIEPNQIVETRKIVPVDSWNASVERHGDRWPHAMAVTRAASMLGPPYPKAHQVIPDAYRSFADIANRGSVVEAIGSERAAVMELEVAPITLNLRPDVVSYLALRDAISPDVEKAVRQEAMRMASLIWDRVRKGGEPSVRINPQRTAPNVSDLNALLIRKWKEQRGRCALCGGGLVIGQSNAMLQASADRIDSANGAYHDTNVWITHLACNWAKNKYGVLEFEEWVGAIRGVDLTIEV